MANKFDIFVKCASELGAVPINESVIEQDVLRKIGVQFNHSLKSTKQVHIGEKETSLDYDGRLRILSPKHISDFLRHAEGVLVKITKQLDPKKEEEQDWEWLAEENGYKGKYNPNVIVTAVKDSKNKIVGFTTSIEIGSGAGPDALQASVAVEDLRKRVDKTLKELVAKKIVFLPEKDEVKFNIYPDFDLIW